MSASKTFERIRKLLGLAQSPNLHEAEAAANMARRLMAQMGIEAVDVETGSDPDPIERTQASTDFRNQWRRNLMHVVGVHCEVQVVMEGGSAFVSLYGFRSSTQVCLYLYEVLERAIENEVLKHLARLGLTRSDWAKYSSEYNSFCISAVGGVSRRFSDVRKAQKEQAPSETALMVRRKDQVDSWMHNQGIRLRTVARRRPQFSREGYEFGRTTPLHSGVEGSSTPTRQLKG